MNEKGIAELIVVGALALVIVGGAVTVVASNNAKPGDTLYSVDRGAEGIQELFVYSNDDRIKFELKQATERLKELKDITSVQAAQKDIDKAAKNYKKAADDYARSIDLAAAKLTEISKSGKEINQKLADTVAETSREQLDSLADVHANLSPEAKDSVERAMASSEFGIEKALAAVQDKVSEEKRQEITDKIDKSRDIRATADQNIQKAFDRVEALRQQAATDGNTTSQQVLQTVQTIIVEAQGQSSSQPGQSGSTSPGSTNTTPGSSQTGANKQATTAKINQAIAKIQAEKQKAAAAGESAKVSAMEKTIVGLRQAAAKLQ